MSNELAIAACTAALRDILDEEFRGDRQTDVTTLPLDKASALGTNTRRLNLFLYQVTPNAAWRNQNFPDRGDRYSPPLAIDLHYLLTAYGDDEAQEDDHKLLGRAMTRFHALPVLSPGDLRQRLGLGGPDANLDRPQAIRDSDLHQQVERIRLTPTTMSLDEMMKLWGTFHQSPYRISTAYQASVVLLEGRTPHVAPFPVLGRGGEDDPGPSVDARLAPALQAVVYRDPLQEQQALPAARLGDAFAVYGSNLPAKSGRLLLFDPKSTRSGDPSQPVTELTLQPESNDKRLLTRLVDQGNLAAGRMVLIFESANGRGIARQTNPVQLLIAPSIVPDDDPQSTAGLVVTFHNNRRVLIAILRPRPGDERPVTLLLTPIVDAGPPAPIRGVTYADRLQLDSPSDNTPMSPTQSLAQLVASPDEVAFDVTAVTPGRYRVRIRVDMVESLPLRRVGDGFVMDSRQEVTL